MMFRIIRHLLPRSRAWALVVGGTLRRFVEGLGNFAATVRLFVDLVFFDLLPRTTRELPRWESQFGIVPHGDDGDRRDYLAANWESAGGQSPKYLEDTLNTAGFPVFIHDWWEPGTTVATDPSSIATNPTIGTVRCNSSAEHQATCQDTGTLDAPQPRCNGFLGNYPRYLVNKDRLLTPPPNLPEDSSEWPRFVYWSGGVSRYTAAVMDSRRKDAFERSLLRLCPAEQWIVTNVDWLDAPDFLSRSDIYRWNGFGLSGSSFSDEWEAAAGGVNLSGSATGILTHHDRGPCGVHVVNDEVFEASIPELANGIRSDAVWSMSFTMHRRTTTGTSTLVTLDDGEMGQGILVRVSRSVSGNVVSGHVYVDQWNDNDGTSGSFGSAYGSWVENGSRHALTFVYHGDQTVSFFVDGQAVGNQGPYGDQVTLDGITRVRFGEIDNYPTAEVGDIVILPGIELSAQEANRYGSFMRELNVGACEELGPSVYWRARDLQDEADWQWSDEIAGALIEPSNVETEVVENRYHSTPVVRYPSTGHTTVTGLPSAVFSAAETSFTVATFGVPGWTFQLSGEGGAHVLQLEVDDGVAQLSRSDGSEAEVVTVSVPSLDGVTSPVGLVFSYNAASKTLSVYSDGVVLANENYDGSADVTISLDGSGSIYNLSGENVNLAAMMIASGYLPAELAARLSRDIGIDNSIR